MNAIEQLIDFLDELERDVNHEVRPLSSNELTWQPAARSNNISVTVWHFSRWLDILTVQALQNRPADSELWHKNGWASHTGYDPRGIGAYGLGAITGFSWDEVKQVPQLTTEQLLAYFSQTKSALTEHLQQMSSDQLTQPAAGLGGSRTNYEWIKAVLKGCFWHIGEIQALKAIKAQESDSTQDGHQS